ncbi:MAG: hypothetical protein ACE5HN_04930 [Nitrospiria bacterium]
MKKIINLLVLPLVVFSFLLISTSAVEASDPPRPPRPNSTERHIARAQIEAFEDMIETACGDEAADIFADAADELFRQFRRGEWPNGIAPLVQQLATSTLALCI